MEDCSQMSQTTQKVTILALAYNHAQYLEETLESIRTQSFQDFELLISDDASSDDSAAVIRRWNSQHGRARELILHDQNIGLCPTLNELLGRSRGEYLQVIACDDHLLPTALEERVAALDSADANTALVYSDALMIDDHGKPLPGTFLKRFLKGRDAPRGDLYSQLLLGNFIPANTVLSRRAFVEEIGGFDAALSFEDWDMWQRLSRNWFFAFTPGPTSRYRIHSGNLHRTMPNQARQFYRILAKHREERRARLRILLTLIRNPDQFEADSIDVQDFLSWADEYPDTRAFRKWYYGSRRLTQAAVSRFVNFMEGLSRPFTKTTTESRRQRRAA